MTRLVGFLLTLALGGYTWAQLSGLWASGSSGASGVAGLPDSLGPDPYPEWGFGEPISPSVKPKISGQVLSFEDHIRAASERADVPTDLIAVVLQEESNGQIDAVGDDGDSYGLGQVQEGAQEDVNKMWGSDLERTDPVENIFLTAGYLRWLKDNWFPWWAPMTMTGWREPVRAYMCGLEGAKDYQDCAAKEADERISLANL